jgi:hypothetical protein
MNKHTLTNIANTLGRASSRTLAVLVAVLALVSLSAAQFKVSDNFNRPVQGARLHSPTQEKVTPQNWNSTTEPVKTSRASFFPACSSGFLSNSLSFDW